MAIFNQEGQQVFYQYNAAGNINFGNVNNNITLAYELKKILTEIKNATKSGILDKEISIGVETKMKKAIVQAEKPNPDKKILLEHIDGAKSLIEGIVSAVGLVSGLAQAAEVVRKIL